VIFFNSAGKPDWIGRIKGDKVNTIIDWKSSATLNRYWRAQIAAYIVLAQKKYNPQKALSLRLSKEGKEAKPYAYDTKDMLNDFNGGFLPALNAHKYFGGIHGL